LPFTDIRTDGRRFRVETMMSESELYFAIPTYRLRDVGETIERYDENFWRNGHSVLTVVLDHSSQATHAVQNHTRNNYMRNPPAAEILNEEVSNLIKRKLKSHRCALEELTVPLTFRIARGQRARLLGA
jgi:hypothetical protein